MQAFHWTRNIFDGQDVVALGGLEPLVSVFLLLSFFWLIVSSFHGMMSSQFHSVPMSKRLDAVDRSPLFCCKDLSVSTAISFCPLDDVFPPKGHQASLSLRPLLRISRKTCFVTIDNENCSDADAAITTSQGFSVRKCFGAAEFCRFFLFPGVIKVFGVTQRQDAKDN